MKIESKRQLVENIFTDLPGYNCVVCAPGHPWGFRSQYYYDPQTETVVSPFSELNPEMAGFPGILHGGFQTMLMDEVMGWAALHFEKKLAFTARMEVKFSKTMAVDEPVEVHGKVDKAGSRLLHCSAWIQGRDEVKAESSGAFFVPGAKELAAVLGYDRVPDKYLPYLRK